MKAKTVLLAGVGLYLSLALANTTLSKSWQADEVADELRTLEYRLNDAVLKGDVDFFESILADDFTHGSQSGQFRTKAEWLKGRVPGKSNYIVFDVEDLNVRINGNAAVVTGLAKPRWREPDGRTQSGQFRFLRAWSKREGKWQVVAFQATEVPAEATPKKQDAIPQEPTPTKEFEIRNDRALLGGKEVHLWGLRCGNALMSQAVTERHVRNLDNFAAHGINCIGVYLQGSNGGWPDAEAGKNGYTPEGALKPDFAERLEWLVREADARGMVVMVGLFSPRKDQDFQDEDAVRRAVEETARFLTERKLKNVFVDIMHEYNHQRIDLDIFREPNGAEKKAKLTRWFKVHAPDIEVGICPTYKSNTEDTYPGMEVRIIQKEAEIPDEGFVVNVETQRQDPYENEGKFEPEEFDIMHAYFESYAAKPNAAMLFHSAYCQGITGKAGSGPHPEVGGFGRSEDDRGIRFYFEWVRDRIGRYEYPQHVKHKN